MGMSVYSDNVVVTVENPAEAGTINPLTKLWNFLKGLLTRETGQAILTERVVGDGNSKTSDFKISYILGVLAVIILIIVIVLVKIKRIKKNKKKKSGKRVGRKERTLFI